MRSWLIVLGIVAAGCGFTTSGLPEDEPVGVDDPGTPPPGPDEPVQPVARKCDAADSTLRLCIDFEDTASFAGDGSGRGHDATTSMVAVMPRDNEHAVLVGASSRIHVVEHPDLDLTEALTVSMWMRSDQYRTTPQFMLDNNRQYAISLQPNGQIRCGLGTVTADSLLSYLDQSWHHVACTFDGSRLKVLVDGNVAGCATATSIPTTGIEGLAIGSNVDVGPSYRDPFVGGLDNVQVFARAWSDAELCTAAGHTGCVNSCGG